MVIKNEERWETESQEEPKGNMTTKCSVASWMGWNRKRTQRKTKEI